MVDQQLIAIHYFSFFLKKILNETEKLSIQKKLSSVVHFHRVSSQAWFFGIIFLKFQKDLSKNEDLTILKCSLPVKSTQEFGGWTSQNCNFYKS